MSCKLLLTVVLNCILFVSCAQAQTVNISVAASMTDVFKALIARFTELHPGTRVVPNFASSGSLAKQIEQGAPADLYVSANPRWMQYLTANKLIDAESEWIFAYNSLVFAGVGGGEVTINELDGLDRIAIGVPESVPAGQYARQALESAGVYGELQRSHKLILAKDVRQALLYADRGEVDGAFVYTTDALLATSARVLFRVPAELHDRIAYPLALTQAGAAKEEARQVYQFMKGPEARSILERYGFEPAH